MSFRACAIVPSYNHHRVVGDIVAALCRLGLPVFVVDDGSDATAAAVLAALDNPACGVRVERLSVNRGKGAAVRHGFALAQRAGFTHALQIDADGQHDLAAVPEMLQLAAAHPTALISGQAVFDASVPMSRRIGRWVTHLWVFIETMSLRITDSMCGLRVYPLATVATVLQSEAVGDRMDFDTAIMVRLCWHGVPIRMVPVRVIYPADNTSNFDVWRDNLRISWMHTRLVFAMLGRLVRGRLRRPQAVETEATHWASLSELGAYCGIRFCIGIYRLIGRRGCLAAIAPIVTYYYLVARRQRQASRRFLRLAFVAAGMQRQPGWFDGLRHFMRFADRMLDTFIGWTGSMQAQAMEPADPAALASFVRDPRGGVIIVSHLGNTDISRTLLDPATRARLLVLMHTDHAANYNRVLREVSPDSVMNVLRVTDIGPDTAISLREHVDGGGWVVIAGDRTPVLSKGRVALVPFLGVPAPFSQGPYILAALMECPVWLLFCRKVGRRYRLMVERFSDCIVLPRGARAEALNKHAAQYAARLQAHALADPFQWYNFYDFWAV